MSSINWHHVSASTWMVPGGNSARRRELNAENELPMLSEIQVRLGAPLSNIFFQSMTDPTAREQMGLLPPLKGPTEELWVSPTDILQGRNLLTEPNSPHCRQALTHQAILNIGAGYESAQVAEMERIIKTTIDEAEKRMKKQKEEAVDLAIQITRADEQERYQILLKIYQKQADEIMQKTIAEVREALIIEANAQKEEALRLLRTDMEKQMLDAITEKEKFIKKKCDFNISWECNKCYESYQDKLIQQQKKWANLFEEAKALFHKQLDKMRIELEAKHLIDVIRVYKETQLEIKMLTEDTNIKIKKCLDGNVKNINEKNDIIAQKIATLKERDFQIKILKEKLHDLALEFQKFIIFILHQKPGQGEYLLSIEEIIKDKPEELFIMDDEETPCQSKKKLPKTTQQTIYLVMALIVDTIMKKTDVNVTEDEIIAEFVQNENPKDDAQEEVKEKVTTEIMDPPLKCTSDFQETDEDYFNKRIGAVKEIFSKYPSVLKLLLATRSSSIVQTQGEQIHEQT